MVPQFWSSKSSLARLCLLALAVFASAASAQTTVPEFRLERFNFNSGARDGLSAASGDLLDQGQVHLLAALHYERYPLVLISDGQRQGSLVAYRTTLHLVGGYGITKWLHVTGELPIFLQGGDSLPGITSPDGFGLVFPLISARVGILSQSDRGLVRDMPLDLAVQLGLEVPLSLGNTFAREFALIPQVSAGRQFGAFRIGGELGFWVRPSNVTLTQGNTVTKDNVGSNISAKLIATYKVIDPLTLELSGHLNGQLAGGQTPAGGEALLGGRYRVGPVDLFLLGGPGFGSLPGTPAWRILGGVSLAPKSDVCANGAKHEPAECPQLDDDGDGIINAKDKCPKDKEDADGYQDEDGCPDPDNDGDGVLDVVDQCPMVKGVPEEHGCPAKPKDTDKDGLTDDVDQCPTQPGPKTNKGCPLKDTDKDGLTDDVDQCPTEPGTAENKGCPVKDRDGDSVPDQLDNCPDEKGDPSNAGCPKQKKQLVEITKDKLVIKDKVNFATGKSVILPASFGLLDQVAGVLKAHPEITGVAIEGHTDNVGNHDANVKLSQARADAVKTYLVKKGIADKQLKAKGYGPDRPTDTNATADGRAANRRVEFLIETAETVKTQTKEVP